jgi:hypothetical protein
MATLLVFGVVGGTLGPLPWLRQRLTCKPGLLPALGGRDPPPGTERLIKAVITRDRSGVGADQAQRTDELRLAPESSVPAIPFPGLEIGM